MISFLNPNDILKQLNLKESMTVADLGCGSGGWVIPLAKKLEGGKVYAIDILEEPLSALKAKANLEKLTNIQSIVADVEKGVDIWEESCDWVLMSNLLFQCEDKKKVLQEAKRILKKRGKILVVDWKVEAAMGPKEGRVSPEEVKKIAETLDLKTEKELDAGAYHYGLILVK